MLKSWAKTRRLIAGSEESDRDGSQNLFFWNKKNRRPALDACTVGLSLVNDTLTLVACTLPNEGRPRIEAWDSAVLSEDLPLRDVLHRFVEQNGLRGRPCRTLLPTYDYSIRLVERPPNVPEEELPEATRWLIRDLVEFDIDQAQMAVLLLPEDDRRARTERMFVIAAREGSLLEMAEAITDAGLTLTGIEILETAMIALEAQIPTTVAGHGILWLDDKSSALTVSLDQQLLLARSLSVEMERLDEAAQWAIDGSEESLGHAHDLLSPLLLEVQRSFDYYESEYGAAPVSQLTLLPCTADSSLLAPLMTEPLHPLKVEAFDFERYFEIDEAPFASHQAKMALAAGTASASPDLLGDALVPRSFALGKGEFGLNTVLRLAAIVSVMMLALYAWNNMQLRSASEELATLQDEHAALRTTLDQRIEEQAARGARQNPEDEIESLRALRNTGLATLRDLERGNTESTIPFSSIMDALARQDLDGVWLERLEVTDGGAEIAIEGRALTASDLPIFLRGLGNEASFKSRRFRTLDFRQPSDNSYGLFFRIASQDAQEADVE